MQSKSGFSLLSKYRGAIMGFAALWILFFHEWVIMSSESSAQIYFLEHFIKRIGFCGVDIFLLLSGLGVTFAIQKSSLPVFYVKRLKRLLPAFLSMAALQYVFGTWSIVQFLKNITFINFYTQSIYSFLWFVPAIATLYFFFPFYYRLFSKASNQAEFTACALIVWCFISILVKDTLRADLFGFTNRIPVFLVGVLFGYLIQNREIVFTRLSWLRTWLMLALGLYLAYMTNYQGLYLLVPSSNCCIPNLLIAASLPFLLASLLETLNTARYTKPVGSALVRFLSFFGSFSLEFYCVQEWLAGVILARMPAESSALIKNLVIFASVTAVGFGLHLAIQTFWKFVDFLTSKICPKVSE